MAKEEVAPKYISKIRVMVVLHVYCTYDVGGGKNIVAESGGLTLRLQYEGMSSQCIFICECLAKNLHRENNLSSRRARRLEINIK